MRISDTVSRAGSKKQLLIALTVGVRPPTWTFGIMERGIVRQYSGKYAFRSFENMICRSGGYVMLNHHTRDKNEEVPSLLPAGEFIRTLNDLLHCGLAFPRLRADHKELLETLLETHQDIPESCPESLTLQPELRDCLLSVLRVNERIPQWKVYSNLLDMLYSLGKDRSEMNLQFLPMLQVLRSDMLITTDKANLSTNRWVCLNPTPT